MKIVLDELFQGYAVGKTGWRYTTTFPAAEYKVDCSVSACIETAVARLISRTVYIEIKDKIIERRMG